MNEVSKTPTRDEKVKRGQFETPDAKLVIYEVGNVNGWMISDVRTSNEV